MASKFHSFVIFAEMRTGSNFLETNLNAMEDVSCMGEAFNPHFIGYPNQGDLLGVSQAERDSGPTLLLDRVRAAPGLVGFRYFHDHDARILEPVLSDEGCAKIMLKRDVVHSYVSWKIARRTGQWKLTDVRKRKAEKVRFDREEFTDFATAQATFRQDVIRRLQISGQPVFHLTYDDLQSVDVLNGLARFLGIDARLEKLDTRLKVQNPEAVSNKISNPDEMNKTLALVGSRDLDDVPVLEIRRAAAVPSYVLGARTPIVYMPSRGAADSVMRHWLAALDEVEVADLPTGLSQREFRQWKRKNPGHRSICVLRHPVARAHEAFCKHIVGMGPEVFNAIRRTLINRYGLPLPSEGVGKDYDLVSHRAAFEEFLRFLKANLNGQTALRIDPSWCSQTQILRGFAGFALPDHILREEELPEVLPQIAARLGAVALDLDWKAPADTPFAASEIYDDKIESLTAAAYQRDYMAFGFGPFA